VVIHKEKNMRTDTDRLDWFEKDADRGGCSALLNDDNGHWTVAGDGMQNVPSGDEPEDISTVFFAEAGAWRATVREAIDAAMDIDEAFVAEG